IYGNRYTVDLHECTEFTEFFIENYDHIILMFRICVALFYTKYILKIYLKCIFYKYDLYKIYVFEIHFFSLFLFKFTFFKNGKNIYNVLKLCIFYKSIANKKTYYFYTIFILDFLLFFIGN